MMVGVSRYEVRKYETGGSLRSAISYGNIKSKPSEFGAHPNLGHLALHRKSSGSERAEGITLTVELFLIPCWLLRCPRRRLALLLSLTVSAFAQTAQIRTVYLTFVWLRLPEAEASWRL